MNQSTAGAVQRFLESCKAAILQANNRSEDEATEAISSDSNFLQYPNTPHPNDGTTLIQTNCPRCGDVNYGGGTCCHEGHCFDGTCQCNEGLSQTDVFHFNKQAARCRPTSMSALRLDSDTDSRLCTAETECLCDV